jgi:hypothetical protein
MNIAGAASLRSAKLKQAAMGGLESGLPLWLQAVVFLLVLIILAPPA